MILSSAIAEQKKQKFSEIRGGLEDAEALIRKMDLEARSLPPSVKAALLAKLREYKTDLNNLKTEVKRITSSNANQAARDDLLELGTTHMFRNRMLNLKPLPVCLILLTPDWLKEKTSSFGRSRSLLRRTEEEES
ncbi:unnamed protein product [Fraxinus pennsylvanica]|uniref:Vesicle transport v-SNARE N-terminal domain-containing protein n=1 Tax=Fraxinus pennsylvanica TaxID=56036 RepID=A0AAD2DK44_9LAMI|nr:unnamed protein product [Fraxinus pennsylvanica]